MVEHLTIQAFLEKISHYEQNPEWKYEGELPALIDFWAPMVRTLQDGRSGH